MNRRRLPVQKEPTSELAGESISGSVAVTAPTSELRPITLPSAAAALFCAMLWGGTAVAIRFTQDDLPPLATAGFRFFLGSLFVGCWFRLQGDGLAVRPEQWLPIALLGFMLFVQISLFHWGLTLTNSSHSSVLIGSHPVFVAVLAHFLLRGDRLTWIRLAGLLTATGGLVMVVGGDQWSSALTDAGRGDPYTLFGDAVVLTSSFLLAAKTVYTKHALGRVQASSLLFWSNVIGTAGFFAASLALEPLATWHIDTGSLLGLLYQGLVVAGFCFAVWTMLLRRHRASQLAVFAFAQPLFGMMLGGLFRHDTLSPWLLAGGAAIAVGVLLVTRES